jgi:hypothetical protein
VRQAMHVAMSASNADSCAPDRRQRCAISAALEALLIPARSDENAQDVRPHDTFDLGRVSLARRSWGGVQAHTLPRAMQKASTGSACTGDPRDHERSREDGRSSGAFARQALREPGALRRLRAAMRLARATSL